MCGIFGYIGERVISDVLINGLKSLEYRGYDSAGIAVQSGEELVVVKNQGRIAFLEEAIDKAVAGSHGIAHTRWATHGEPSKKNAHPHLSSDGSIAIVHNGIIENYQELRRFLTKKGHTFVTNTDSEVIAHLIAQNYEDNGTLKDGFLGAVQTSVSQLEGTYGLAIVKKGEKRIIVAKNGSPLIIGIGQYKDSKEFFVSSDATAIHPFTNRINFLQDKEVAVITQDDYEVFNMENSRVKKKVEKIQGDLDAIKKGNYKHFMQKEIFEQPKTVHDAFRGRLREKDVRLDGVEEVKKLMDIERTRLIACGTSWHAALVGEYLIEELADIPVEVDYASEFRYRNMKLKPGELVVAVSQSGETMDTLEAVKLAKQSTKTFGIVNAVGSAIARETSAGIYIHAGPEIGVASTKAFTGQIVCLYLLALQLGIQKGLVKDYEMHKKEIQALPEKIQQILLQEEKIVEIAKQHSSHSNYLFLGRGINFPVALEGALKLKEISYIHAEGYPAAEMKHGPIALIDENMPVVFIASDHDELYKKVLSNMEEVKARHGKIIALVDKNDDALDWLADYQIIMPKSIKPVAPILNAIPLQLLAYHTAVLKGLDPDKPRNLAKSVTVE